MFMVHLPLSDLICGTSFFPSLSELGSDLTGTAGGIFFCKENVMVISQDY